MDALKFLKERSRMCKSYGACGGCPLEGAKCAPGSNTSAEDYKRIIAAVEQWSKEHPRKTRQSEFLKQWPEAKTDIDDVLCLCPAMLFADYGDAFGGCVKSGTLCPNCRREFWMQEVE